MTGELDRRNLSVHDAQLFINREGMAMNTFVVLEPDSSPLAPDRHLVIRQALLQILQPGDYRHPRVRRPSPKLCYFNVDTSVVFLASPTERRRDLELTALDQPGLLPCVSEVFVDLGISLHGARISTIGERLEDLFILPGGDCRALRPAMQAELRRGLIESLNSNDKM